MVKHSIAFWSVVSLDLARSVKANSYKSYIFLPAATQTWFGGRRVGVSSSAVTALSQVQCTYMRISPPPNLHTQFDCCGWESYTDWISTKFFTDSNTYPSSCDCATSEENCINVVDPQLQNIWNQVNDLKYELLFQFRYMQCYLL